MSLITVDGATLAFGQKLLLDHARFVLDARERVCLIGRNGVGKSTLLKVLCGDVVPDDGIVWRRDTSNVAILEQDVPAALPNTVYQTVAAGLPELGRVLAQYHDESQALAHDAS